MKTIIILKFSFREFKKSFLLFLFILTTVVAHCQQSGAGHQYQNQSYVTFPENVRAPYELPAIWSHQNKTENPHFIIVFLEANPRINDIPLEPGDFIGAFYTDDYGNRKCGGADYWLGDENIIFPCYRDDDSTTEKDGFLPGEQIYFKLFCWATQKEYDVTLVVFDPSFVTTDKWYPLGLSGIINIATFTVFDAYATATPNPICIGDEVTLSANILIGTTGIYTYLWTSDPAGLNSTLQTVTQNPTVTTTYFLSVSDGTNISQHNIEVIVNTPPWITPGPDQTICEDQTVSVTAFPENNSGILWSSSGDGSFNNPSLINPVYTPGTADKANGNITLIATALPKAPCIEVATTDISVKINPIASLELIENISFCKIDEMWISAEATNYSSIEWTTNGDGTIINPNSTTIRYIPGSFDLSLGYFKLTCCVNSIAPCTQNVCKQTLVTIVTHPTVNSPVNKKGCENTAISLNAIAKNYSSILWITNGDGVFNNPNILNPSYTPGVNDKLNGGTVVTVTAFGNIGCEAFPASSNTTIIIESMPKLNPGNTGIFCKGYPLQMDASAQFYNSLTWSTSGDGTFNNKNILNPIYYPGANDLETNSFDLTLTATAKSPCTGSVSLVLPITLVTETTAQILTAAGLELCKGDTLQLNSEATGYTSIQWTTTGDGSFDDSTSLNPIYFPGPVIDYSGIPIQLKLTAFTPQNCGPNIEKNIQVSFNLYEPEVFIGEDATITEPSTFFTNPVVPNYTSLFWQTSGDGQFENPNNLITEYIPGILDLQNGSTLLILTTVGQGNCYGPALDTLMLTIFRKHQIEMETGWQGISSFVTPLSSSFEILMTQISNQLAIAQNMLETYWPEYGINTINDFSNQNGYQVKLTSPTTLEVIGYDFKPKTVNFDFGWNIMPVASGCNILSSTITDQLGDKLIIIKEIGEQGVIWPQQGVYQISYFIPGKAYMIKVTEPATVTFPTCTNPKK